MSSHWIPNIDKSLDLEKCPGQLIFVTDFEEQLFFMRLSSCLCWHTAAAALSSTVQLSLHETFSAAVDSLTHPALPLQGEKQVSQPLSLG